MIQWDERDMGAVHDSKNIKGFFGDYRWLSNYHICEVVHEGLVYGSSEAAYQAAKLANVVERAPFTEMDPSQSKKAGQTVKLRGDWNTYKLQAMREILTDKFTRNENLRKLLKETGDRYLEETNWWNDTYWGVCNYTGENQLGRMLMEIRDEI
jgi:ribA/ribD-fused uncharacterized protein